MQQVDLDKPPTQSDLIKSLENGSVHVWVTQPQHITDADRLKRYRSILNAHEQGRYERYLFDEHRHLFLVAHALVRCALSHYAAVHPADWRFEVGPYGRPEIAAEHKGLELRFNLSHTQGLAACAICLKDDVGVDVEWLQRDSETSAIAHRYFSADEVQTLRSLPTKRQRERFFCYWTLKEAYIKACGMGLAIPLGSFSFLLEDNAPSSGSIGIAFGEERQDTPSDWHFHLQRVGEEHLLALARKSFGQTPWSPQIWTCVPEPAPR